MVILGAGASHDSVPGPPFEQRLTWRPPLAAELFSRSEFGPAIQKYSEMAGIVHRFRDLPSGTSVEAELEVIQSSADGYPRALQELMAVRYYLQDVLRSCTDGTLGVTNSVTNYATLVSKLDRWRKQDEIVVVNFNYDTLFDHAFRSQLGVASSDPDSHINGALGWRHIKVHGSWDWAVTLSGNVPHSPGSSGPNPHDVIRAARGVKPAENYVSWSWEVPANYSFIPTSSVPVMPAIAIPLRTKSTFACPSKHIDILRASLPQVDRILVIGWRGQDLHFLNELRVQKLRQCQVLVVTKTQAGGAAVQEGLIGTGLPATYDLFHEETRNENNAREAGGPFTRILRGTRLENFLLR